MSVDVQEDIFDVLPGEVHSVKGVMDELSRMWNVNVPDGEASPVEFRASQMNLVLHFGLRTTREQALDAFNSAIGFAQRYPCRIVVLCPRGRELSDKLLEGKLFAQCYIGETMRDMCCCEALMLGYPTRVAGFLDNQVSIWLENDLPTYHWFFRIPAERVINTHTDFIRRCRRIIFDSSLEDEDYLQIPWERPEAVVDLAYARLLPVRQSLGQFLSSFSPERLLEGLERVEVKCSVHMRGEGRHLLNWLRNCLEDCAKRGGHALEVAFSQDSCCEVEDCSNCSGGHCLEALWHYQEGSGKHFEWSLSGKQSDAHIDANFGRGGEIRFPMKVRLLSGEKALPEALFFA